MSGMSTAFAILMVGHSLFGKTSPDMLEAALKAAEMPAQVEEQIINGAPLSYNWDNAKTAEGVNARARLTEGGVTHLILTEAVPLAPNIQWNNSAELVQRFYDLAQTSSPGAQVFLQETWHDLRSGTGVVIDGDAEANLPWRSRLDLDLPKWESLIEAADLGPAGSLRLIPAGQAFGQLHDELALQKVPGLSGISDLFEDDIHLNDTGHYFVSMVQFATITGQNPLGLPVDFKNRWGSRFDLPEAETAAVLQKIAWSAVQEYFDGDLPQYRVENISSKPETQLRTPTGPPPEQVLQRAIGLSGIADWSTQQPFLDVMKTARPWFGHLAGKYGGVTHAELRQASALDAEGWPIAKPKGVRSLGTLILTDLPEEFISMAGRYVLRYEGSGLVEVAGRARNLRYGDNQISFEFEPGPGSVELRIRRMDPDNPPRNITVIAEKHLAAFDGGALFNPAWTDHLAVFSALRFMDWMETNDSKVKTWDQHPKPSDATFVHGVPVEVMVELSNQLGKDAWVNMPHGADDDFVRNFATTVRDHLDPRLKVYVEFSNEVWNWQFEQAVWADEAAKARWGQEGAWMQYYGIRAAEVADIWSDVFSGADRERLVNVISSQTGWMGLEKDAFEAPLGQAEGVPAPHLSFDAYAVSGYLGATLGLDDNEAMLNALLAESTAAAIAGAEMAGLTGSDAAKAVARSRFDLATQSVAQELSDGSAFGKVSDTVQALRDTIWPYHAAVAQKYDLGLVMYEGGSHVVGVGSVTDNAELTAFFVHFNYTSEMGLLYQQLIQAWTKTGGTLFNAYADVYAPVKWGSWGALRHLDDENPRWDALVGNEK